ncbi:MAG: aminotransferase class I/II-fold pyridoxal phosphate-dependent enzyme [Patescibacteria group bacterium]|nr:aminotransferase class I/II-fold pyridoxal phosphate-dependent enzyme [Patescibacteria group bacterium]
MPQTVHISPIKEMELRSAKVPNVVSLAQGIPSFDTPETIKRRTIEAIQQGKVARYSLSPGLLELREAIEYDLAKRNIFYDFEKEIIVTAGSIEAITATFLALLQPGDEVLIPDPTYTSYQSAIKTARAVSVFVPLDEQRDWAFDIEQFKKRITSKTRAILFCNPNNPTSTVYSRSQLMEIAQLAEVHNLYVLSDEVYKDFLYNGQDFYSLAQFKSFRKRFVYIFSFSKAYAMTGWRVAYLAVDQKLADRIIGVHDALVTCAPVVSQWGALAALEMADDDVKRFHNEFVHRKKVMCLELDKMKKSFSYAKPSSAYFTFPRMSERLIQYVQSRMDGKNKYGLKKHQKNSISWNFALELLHKAKVAVVPGVAFGPTGENHIRLCFGRTEENIVEAMKRIEKFVQNI